jgi:hypothetical protein
MNDSRTYPHASPLRVSDIPHLAVTLSRLHKLWLGAGPDCRSRLRGVHFFLGSFPAVTPQTATALTAAIITSLINIIIYNSGLSA